MPRLVVLEGVPGAGKTAASRQLEEEGWQRVRFDHLRETSEFPDRVQWWISQISVALEQGDTVVDGLHLSEHVYGRLLRGDMSAVPPFDHWVMEGWLAVRQACVMWLLNEGPELNKLLKEQTQGLVLAGALINRFHDAFLNRSGPVVIMTEEETVYEKTLKLVDVPLVVDESAGSLTPRAWFVGQQHNLRTIANGRERSNTCFSAGCGVHLFRALTVAGLDWSEIHLSNAYADDGRLRDLDSKWEALGEPRVVALGQAASKALSQHLIPHHVVDHPSYARRFRRYEVLEYASELRAAAKT